MPRSTSNSYCHGFLAFILKLLNFLQTFVGLSIIVYSIYMLSRWYHHDTPVFPPPSPAPSPGFSASLSFGLDAFGVPNQISISNFATDASFSGFNSLPAPWFIYAFMGVGIMLCCITCTGHIAAEAINGCCLCFYALLTTLLVLVEAALVTFIILDPQWQKVLPFDPTGQLDNLRTFIRANADVCKWFGITIVIIQTLSLLIAIILRAMLYTRRVDDDIEGDYAVSSPMREPLLNTHLHQSPSVRGDGRGAHSDIWSSRMRQKYGLNGGGDAKHSVSQDT